MHLPPSATAPRLPRLSDGGAKAGAARGRRVGTLFPRQAQGGSRWRPGGPLHPVSVAGSALPGASSAAPAVYLLPSRPVGEAGGGRSVSQVISTLSSALRSFYFQVLFVKVKFLVAGDRGAGCRVAPRRPAAHVRQTPGVRPPPLSSASRGHGRGHLQVWCRLCSGCTWASGLHLGLWCPPGRVHAHLEHSARPQAAVRGHRGHRRLWSRGHGSRPLGPAAWSVGSSPLS